MVMSLSAVQWKWGQWRLVNRLPFIESLALACVINKTIDTSLPVPLSFLEILPFNNY